jgi:hypothetical protein
MRRRHGFPLVLRSVTWTRIKFTFLLLKHPALGRRLGERVREKPPGVQQGG